MQQQKNVVYGKTIEVAYKNMYAHVHEEEYLISIGK